MIYLLNTFPNILIMFIDFQTKMLPGKGGGGQNLGTGVAETINDRCTVYKGVARILDAQNLQFLYFLD